MNIESVIPVGKENAIHLQELANIIGVSIQTVKEQVRKARNNGALICSNSYNGYWIAETRADILECIALMEKQAKTRFNTVRQMRIKCGEIEGQMKLEEIPPRIIESVTNGAKTT